MSNRYRLLRGLGYLFLILGWLALAAGLLLGIVGATTPGFQYLGDGQFRRTSADLANGFPYFAIGGAGILLLFLSQLISILHGIEENTRASSIALRHLINARSRQAPPD